MGGTRFGGHNYGHLKGEAEFLVVSLQISSPTLTLVQRKSTLRRQLDALGYKKGLGMGALVTEEGVGAGRS
jgi:hypothetical protein